jgi:nicotinate (nicotinamide) nucleotide adenylyltransferase
MADVALLGGGLDPISLHHEEMVDQVRNLTGMPTWVMPCYGHLFAKASRLTDSFHRLNMVLKTAENRRDDFFVPFDWEIKNQHSGSMYETVNQLKCEFPDLTFHIVIGMDNANLITTNWDRGNLLIQENPFIVFDREGIDRNATWFLEAPHNVYPMDYGLSSTAIRNAIQNGDYEFASSHLNPGVWQYIKTNKLYGY